MIPVPDHIRDSIRYAQSLYKYRRNDNKKNSEMLFAARCFHEECIRGWVIIPNTPFNSLGNTPRLLKFNDISTCIKCIRTNITIKMKETKHDKKIRFSELFITFCVLNSSQRYFLHFVFGKISIFFLCFLINIVYLSNIFI